MAAGSTKQKLSCEMHVVRFNVKYYPLTLKEAQKLNGVKALVQKYCYGSMVTLDALRLQRSWRSLNFYY